MDSRVEWTMYDLQSRSGSVPLFLVLTSDHWGKGGQNFRAHFPDIYPCTSSRKTHSPHIRYPRLLCGFVCKLLGSLEIETAYKGAQSQWDQIEVSVEESQREGICRPLFLALRSRSAPFLNPTSLDLSHLLADPMKSNLSIVGAASVSNHTKLALDSLLIGYGVCMRRLCVSILRSFFNSEDRKRSGGFIISLKWLGL